MSAQPDPTAAAPAPPPGASFVDLRQEGGAFLIRGGTFDLYHEAEPGGRRRFLFRLPEGATLIAHGPTCGGGLVALGRAGARAEPVSAGSAAVEDWLSRWVPPLIPAAPGWPQVIAEGAQGFAEGQVARIAPGTRGVLRIEGGPVLLWGEVALAPGQYPVWPGLWLCAGDMAAAVRSRLTLVPEEGAPDPLTALAPLQAALLHVLDAEARAETAARAEAAARVAEENHARLSRAVARLARPETSDAGAGDEADPPRHLDPAERAVLAALATIHRLERATWQRADAERAMKVPVERGYAAAPERVQRILKSLSTGVRGVRLDAAFWQGQGPPVIAWRGAAGEIGVLARQGGRWQFLTETRAEPISRAGRADFTAQGLQIYPWDKAPAPGLRGLLRHAGRGGGADRLRMGLAGAMVALCGMGLPFFLHAIFDTALPRGDRLFLAVLIGGLLVMAVTQALFDLLLQLGAARIAARLELRSQPFVLQRLMRLPLRFFRTRSSGDVLDRALSLNAARLILGNSAARLLLALPLALAGLVPMLFFDPALAVAGIALAVAGSGLQAAMALPVQSRNRRAFALQGRVEALVLQLFRGIAKLRVAAAEPRAMALWATAYAQVRDARISAQRWGMAQSVLADLVWLGSFLALMLATAWRNGLLSGDPLAMGGAMEITAAEFVAFAAAFGQVTAAGRSAAQALVDLAEGIALARRATPLLSEPVEPFGERILPGRLSGAIELRGLSFRHDPEGPPVLDGVSLSVLPGSRVAIVGPSGSGKSTLLRLILGLERPEAGEILFDGLPIDRIDPASLREQLGAVLQDGRISGGTILDNISGDRVLGIHDAWDAARRVGLDRDIEAMPMGLHTLLQDGGASLSGGQRQRILIARAIAGAPAIMVLDEATSALDNRVQARVMETLHQMNVTRIVVAHRLSTIRDADVIHVLIGGRIVQSGPYDRLAGVDGPFRQLIDRQSQ